MTQHQTSLFFIAILPPSPLREKLMAFKTYFKENYQSKASLNSSHHITLHMPFRYKEQKLLGRLDALQRVAATTDEMTLHLKGFAAFAPRVIYAHVEENKALNELQKRVVDVCRSRLKLDNANYKNQAFHPHITLAFRDLKKAKFKEAWQEFENKKLDESFAAHSIWLLKHNGKEWKEYKELKFRSK